MPQALERVQLIFETHGDTRFDHLRLETDSDPPDSDLHNPGRRDSTDDPSLTSNTARPLTQNRFGWPAAVRVNRPKVAAERRWYISAQTWKDEICRSFDVRALSSELEKRGALEMELERDGRKRPPRVMINGDRHRYYAVTPRIFSVALDPSDDDPDVWFPSLRLSNFAEAMGHWGQS